MSTPTASERVEITPELLGTLEETASAVPFKVWQRLDDEDDGVCCVVAPKHGEEPWWILAASQNVPGDEDGEFAANFAATASPAVVLALLERIRSDAERIRELSVSLP